MVGYALILRARANDRRTIDVTDVERDRRLRPRLRPFYERAVDAVGKRVAGG
jgi:hypothetical protein